MDQQPEEIKAKIEQLLRRVEETFGQGVVTSRHFDLLRESIRSRTGVLLSATTLKRLWGYLAEEVSPRLHTLDTLSRYAGWKDWDSFLNAPHAGAQSGPVESQYIDVMARMTPGETLALTWLPDRECRIRYAGDGWFEVLVAKCTRLQAGDRFRCLSIIQGEPLYLDHLTREGKDLGIYVCGRESGVRFAASK